MEVIAAQIAHLQQESARQAALIQAQGTTILSLSSTIARLSSENRSKDIFIRRVEDKLFPAGFWVWEKDEEGSETGHWVFSKDKHRKLPLAIASKSPAPFYSLPDEILEQILLPFRFSPPTLARLSNTSRRFLKIVSPRIYNRIDLSIKSAASFLNSRLLPTLPRSPQITTLLLPTNVYLYSPTFPSQIPDFAPFDALPLDHPPFLNVNLLAVNLQSALIRLEQWAPVLHLFNPK